MSSPFMVTEGEGWILRAWLTAIVVVLFFALMPITLLAKLAEGVYVSLRITNESLRQVWARKD